MVGNPVVFARVRLPEAEVEQHAAFDPLVGFPGPLDPLGGANVAGFERVEESIEDVSLRAADVARSKARFRAFPEGFDLGFEVRRAHVAGTHRSTSEKS